jgi:hypothetical protein
MQPSYSLYAPYLNKTLLPNRSMQTRSHCVETPRPGSSKPGNQRPYSSLLSCARFSSRFSLSRLTFRQQSTLVRSLVFQSRASLLVPHPRSRALDTAILVAASVRPHSRINLLFTSSTRNSHPTFRLFQELWRTRPIGRRAKATTTTTITNPSVVRPKKIFRLLGPALVPRRDGARKLLKLRLMSH